MRRARAAVDTTWPFVGISSTSVSRVNDNSRLLSSRHILRPFLNVRLPSTAESRASLGRLNLHKPRSNHILLFSSECAEQVQGLSCCLHLAYPRVT